MSWANKFQGGERGGLVCGIGKIPDMRADYKSNNYNILKKLLFCGKNRLTVGRGLHRHTPRR
jgi:hypothetical protein